MRAVLVGALAAAIAVPVAANPPPPRAPAPAVTRKATDPAHARAALRKTSDVRGSAAAIGRRPEPLTAKEQTHAEIEKLLRSQLKRGTTGVFIADAKTGEPLFAFNADNRLNPASNVKMISTATALELLGAEFRYPTRLLGPEPQAGVVRGDVFLLGSYDPTLKASHLDEMASAVAARGITSIEGSITVGSDPTRDGLYRAVVPIEVVAGEPGKPPTATVAPGAEHVSVRVTAVTSKRKQRARLTFTSETAQVNGRPHVTVTVAGTISKGRSLTHPFVTRERTATAVYALRAALKAHGVQLAGDLKIRELGDFIGEAVATGSLPVELARHESRSLSEIVAKINKWSINWLADRVIMTAAALSRQQPPSMELALDAMYGWLARHTGLDKSKIVIDTGSGLSYRTQITPHDLVSVVRSAAGFTNEDTDPMLSQAWLDSLAHADGTLRRRFGKEARTHIRGKTGTLSTVIAVSGVLDVNPDRPLAFSIVTNTDRPLSKARVRKAHDQLLALVAKFVAPAPVPTAPIAAPMPSVPATTAAAAPAAPIATPMPTPTPAGELTPPPTPSIATPMPAAETHDDETGPDDVEETEGFDPLDDEASGLPPP
ncbi:MAG: D-alanyl-D-alanine carboxypeptidase/D-alanyl-D-alanine-endopeptidase [Kofleriaceae bacterium]